MQFFHPGPEFEQSGVAWMNLQGPSDEALCMRQFAIGHQLLRTADGCLQGRRVGRASSTGGRDGEQDGDATRMEPAGHRGGAEGNAKSPRGPSEETSVTRTKRLRARSVRPINGACYSADPGPFG